MAATLGKAAKRAITMNAATKAAEAKPKLKPILAKSGAPKNAPAARPKMAVDASDPSYGKPFKNLVPSNTSQKASGWSANPLEFAARAGKNGLDRTTPKAAPLATKRKILSNVIGAARKAPTAK